MNAEQRYQNLPDDKPPAPPLGGVYKPVVVTGDLVWVSGHGPMTADGDWIRGCLGADLDLKEGQAAARLVGLGILASLRAEFGGLERIGRVVKLLGMVNATSDFTDHPKVVNGCSELFVEIFGKDAGAGARSAVGMASLPSRIAVEIEAVFELLPEVVPH